MQKFRVMIGKTQCIWPDEDIYGSKGDIFISISSCHASVCLIHEYLWHIFAIYDKVLFRTAEYLELSLAIIFSRGQFRVSSKASMGDSNAVREKTSHQPIHCHRDYYNTPRGFTETLHHETINI